MTLQVIYDVSCSFCGAGLDRPCVSSAGKILPVPHVVRRTTFRIAKAAEPPKPVRPRA